MKPKLNFNALANFNEPIRSRWELFYNLLDSIIEHKNQKVYHFTVSPRVNAFIESLMNYEWNTKSFIFKDKLFFVHVDVYNTKTELIFQNIKFIE